MRPAKGKSEPEIAALVTRSLKALNSLLESLEPAQVSKLNVSSHLARFKLWSASLGAHRATGTRALEYRLRDASSIKQQVISLLGDLLTAIEQAQATTQGQSKQSQDDPVYDEIEAYFLAGDVPMQSPLDLYLAEIGHIIDCLLRLSATISNPAPHDQFQSRAGAAISEYYERWDVMHVQEKFKDIDSTIAIRLGKAVTMRRNYFRYRKEHHDKLSEGLEDGNLAGGDETTIASSIPKRLKDTPEMTLSLGDLHLDNQSQFSVTSYAPSSADPDQLTVPVIPQEHLEGPFLCPFCQMIIEVETRQNWKKHVFRDLRPYVCIEKSCPTSTRQYARRGEWIHHMKQDHWKTWFCSFGCSGTFPSRDIWHEHNRAAHGQEVPDKGLQILETSSTLEDLNQAVGNCPLCSAFHIKDPRQYSSHIGHHLELLALFSLPKIGGNEDGVEGETGQEDDVQQRDNSSSLAGHFTTLIKAEEEYETGEITNVYADRAAGMDKESPEGTMIQTPSMRKQYAKESAHYGGPYRSIAVSSGRPRANTESQGYIAPPLSQSAYFQENDPLRYVPPPRWGGPPPLSSSLLDTSPMAYPGDYFDGRAGYDTGGADRLASRFDTRPRYSTGNRKSSLTKITPRSDEDSRSKGVYEPDKDAIRSSRTGIPDEDNASNRRASLSRDNSRQNTNESPRTLRRKAGSYPDTWSTTGTADYVPAPLPKMKPRPPVTTRGFDRIKASSSSAPDPPTDVSSGKERGKSPPRERSVGIESTSREHIVESDDAPRERTVGSKVMSPKTMGPSQNSAREENQKTARDGDYVPYPLPPRGSRRSSNQEQKQG